MPITMDDIRDNYAGKDFERGVEYYRQGKVSPLDIRWKDGMEIVRCSVYGSQTYRVSFRLDKEGFDIQCSCPWSQLTGSCKHQVAALIAYVKQPRGAPSTTDYHARNILQRYLDRGLEQTPEAPVRLVPRLQNQDFEYDDGYPAFSLRVGRGKLYAVRNVREFLRYVDEGQTTSYGKELTLNHSPRQFDAPSQTLLRLLMNEYDQRREIEWAGASRQETWGSRPANEIVLSGTAFDRLFDLLAPGNVESKVGGQACFLIRDPEVDLTLQKKGQSATLKITVESMNGGETRPRFRFFGGRDNLYLMNESCVMRCSSAFQEKVYPLLEHRQRELRFSLQDLPSLCSCVLTEMQDLVTLEDPEGILQDYLPQECTPCFYLDMEEDALKLKLTFRYDSREIPMDAGAKAAKGIKRDLKAEAAARQLAGQYFREEGGFFTLEGEEPVYTFLTESIDRFRQQGDVFVSDRLRSKQIPAAQVGVGLSVTDGLLSLSLDTGGFPPEELAALYQSLLQRRKYHRLADGRYLKLDGSPYEKMAEMTHMLQLGQKELAQGTIILPAFRGLYLDGLLTGGDGIQVNRDRQFRSMVRSFKSVSEGDYALPEHLEGILRPYQKTGFQWLKTLEGYGFGGILADEMGLGKTLQVIAYLATVPRQAVGHPSLVVCPASLIYNWGEELAKFAPELRYRLILGSAAARKALRAQAGEADIWITSYELLRQDIQDYASETFYACVLDEAQHIKNQSTQISRAVKHLNAHQRFALTGTPVENRLGELWNLFDFLMPGYLFTRNTFQEKLEKPILKSGSPEATAQLRRLVQPFLLRRLKKDVLKELPPKEEHVRRIPLSEEERKTYHACVLAAQTDLAGTEGKLQILAALTRLRQVCCDPNLCFENYQGPASKVDACLELCRAMVENNHQILLFSQFTSMLDRLRAGLDSLGISSFTLQGSTSKEARARLVKAFNAGEASVFLISLKAGGTGLNLTAADIVIHFDPWWNQAAQDQATDRAHRIGQQAHVQVYKLITKDTIEEKILELQDRKSALMDTISGAEEGGILDMSKEDLLSLLEI